MCILFSCGTSVEKTISENDVEIEFEIEDITKTRLKWYLSREEKYTKKFLEYKKLHTSLSLAVASGFSNVKSHQAHLKSLSQRTEKTGKVEE